MLKADAVHLERIESNVKELLHDAEIKVNKVKDDQLTLEHYTERYVPI